MPDRPIGIFDSGLGGLTALRPLRKILKDIDIIYYADTARMPYGEKSRDQLRHMAEQNLAFLLSFNVRAVLVACGTLSANAPDILEACPVPAVGVLKPSVNYIQKIKTPGPLAVLATEASIRSEKYQEAIREACPDRRLFAVPCPDFVPLIEAGFHSQDAPVREAVARTLDGLRAEKPAAVLLGCTHYGIISQAISDYLGPEVRLISAAECGAEELAGILMQNGETGGRGEIKYYTSGRPDYFSLAAARLLQLDYHHIQAEAVIPQAI